MSDLLPLTPLGHRDPVAGADATVEIREVADRAMFDLRIANDDQETADAVGAALGFALPGSPRTSAGSGERLALWLSIDQWLITAPVEQRVSLATGLADAVGGRFAMLTDMSDARAVIRLEGDGGREIIMKGAAADLTRPECGVGHIRRMLFAGVAAMVHVVATNPDILDLYVFRSYADHAWDWFAKAARPGSAVRLFARQDPPAV